METKPFWNTNFAAPLNLDSKSFLSIKLKFSLFCFAVTSCFISEITFSLFFNIDCKVCPSISNALASFVTFVAFLLLDLLKISNFF